MTAALSRLTRLGRDIGPLPTYSDLDAIAARRGRGNPRLDPRLLRWLAPYLARETDGRHAWRVDPALVAGCVPVIFPARRR
ncbi:MAG TPA: hypothetical protein VMU94_03165 [Streptosporangiaceae bacterium]|nr:hypothetical protein [Streptosporangiaceae bacterium]